MAFVVNDRVKELSETTGTGTLNLDGAPSGFQSFVAGIGSGNSTYYAISLGSQFEVGIGTVTDATPDTLSRDTVIKSSNSDNLVNFGAGAKEVFCTLPASKAILVDSSSNIDVTGATFITTSDGDITLTPNGTGVVKLDGLSYPTADGTAGQVLETNGSGILSFTDATLNVQSEVYDTGTDATWTKPTSASFIEMRIWGGGGSGAEGDTNDCGGGGGGGACNIQVFPFSYFSGATVTYTVGAGGAGQTVADGDGNPGGTSSVTISDFNGTGSKTFSAFGGGGGDGGTTTTTGGGGGGGGVLSAGSVGGATAGGEGGGPGDAIGGSRFTNYLNACGGSIFAYTNAEGSAYGGGGGGSGFDSTDGTGTKHGGSSYFGGGGGGGGFPGAGTTAITAGGNSYYGGGGGGGGVASGTGGSGGTSVFGGAGSPGTTSTTASSAGSVPGGGSGGTEDGDSGAGGGGRVQFLYW